MIDSWPMLLFWLYMLSTCVVLHNRTRCLAALQAYFQHENLKIYCMHFGSEILCCEVCFHTIVINHLVIEVKSLACVGLLVY